MEDSYYIGGYYGASNEMTIMKEIRARGPVSGDLLVPSTFGFYTNGIFSEDHVIALKKLQEDEIAELRESEIISELNFDDYELTWQLINHSILIVGWGIDVINGEEVKYWLCRNSYG